MHMILLGCGTPGIELQSDCFRLIIYQPPPKHELVPTRVTDSRATVERIRTPIY